ncbi:uncharacterized protein CEXT_132701 [Caerostris extrusa]|uniref:Uncharacterized protein n=1 Tax=Caerostris extrusa TaxID=172846 RepID=A0AAV4TUF4_CAEEX|nr:uncharacterized protein CEXT_132701 [Caerostris extrusa]
MAPSRNLPLHFSAVLMVLLWPVVTLAASIAAKRCPVIANHCSCVFNGPLYSLRCNALEEMARFRTVLANISENAVILELDAMQLDFFPINALHNTSVHTLIIGNSTFKSFYNLSQVHQAIPNLHHISLENVTFLERVQWRHFSSLNNLQVLFVYNSSVESVIPANFSQHMSKEVVSITITESNITRIEKDSLKDLTNLTTLRISHNSLRTFERGVLSQVSKLEQLRLDSNKIRFLPAGVFEDLPHVKVVSLSNNTMSSLPEDVFSALWKPDVYLDLRGNPIKCDSRILWTVTSETKPERIIENASIPNNSLAKI